MKVYIFCMNTYIKTLIPPLPDFIKEILGNRNFNISDSFEQENDHKLFLKNQTGPMRMASNFRKLKLLASIFVPNVNLIILAYI